MKLVLMLALVLAAGDKDKDAVSKTAQDFADAWNKHDAKAMTAYFTDDGDLINPMGRHAKGKAEIEKLFQDEQSTVFKNSQFTATCAPDDIKMIKPDVAVMTCNWEASGAKTPDGKTMTPKGMVTVVVVKKGGKWMWMVARPMVPPQMPAGAHAAK